MPIRCVAFDADDTLWDFTTAMGQALGRVVAAAREFGPPAAAGLDAEDLKRRFDRLEAEHQAERPPGRTMAGLRARSFQEALADLGVDDPSLVDRLAETYFEHRHGQLTLFDDVIDVLDDLAERHVLGLVTNGGTDAERGGLGGRFAFRIAADSLGVPKPDPRVFLMAAVAADCRPNELVYVGDHLANDVVGPQAAGCRGVWLNRSGAPCPAGVNPDATIADLRELPAVIARFDAEDDAASGRVGVGPHPEPWPDDDRLDPLLLAGGDRRNVVDRYRYWREEAIVADLDAHRHPFHVAIENWQHDRNIGAVVRNANAFGAAAVHIVGRRRWNRRGAMSTDRYQHVHHHASVADLADWAAEQGLALVGLDNVPGSVPLEATEMPERALLLFGQEGPGLSPEAVAACERVCAIAQFGSTRSINAGVASGIAMHAWVRQHALGGDDR